MSNAEKYRIPWEKTCWSCDSESFNFECTDELVPLDRFIGQDRAQEALRFGLEVDKPGYNLFVTGLTGTGKTSVSQSTTGPTYTISTPPTVPPPSGFHPAPARP